MCWTLQKMWRKTPSSELKEQKFHIKKNKKSHGNRGLGCKGVYII